MDSSKLNDWTQTAGIIAVIAGLLLVAYELRQNSRIARAQMNAQQNVFVQSLHGAFRDREFASVFQKMVEQPDSLSLDEALMVDGYFRELMNLLWLDYTMKQRGIFEDSSAFWADYAVRHGLGTEFGRNWWTKSRKFGPLDPIIDESLERLDGGEIQLEHLIR